MRVFDLGPLLERIEEAINEGLEPDPALVELLVQEGPKAVEQFWDLIDMTQADADLLATRIKELQGRKAAREQAVERMKGVLQDLLKRHFNGKIKTATITTWVQSTKTYTVTGADPVKHPQFFKTPEPEFKKSLVLDLVKAEQPLPEGIEVTEGFTESPRVKR